MQDYLEPIVEARRVNPGDDLISDIVRAEVNGERLSDAEIYGFLRLLLPAGSESTFRSMASALCAMLTVPGLYQRALADRSLLPLIVEETLRWDVANTMVSRVTTCDTELGGCPIPAGSALLVMTSSANRDERHFADPDRFDPDRPSIRHLGFGAGPHQCLGLHLARIELRIGLDTILDRLPNLRLDPAFPMPEIGGFGFRGPDALHVLFHTR
jgi:cytochrome P450